jgi:hypothetical protein
MLARWLLGSTIASVLLLRTAAGIGAEAGASRLEPVPGIRPATAPAPPTEIVPPFGGSNATIADNTAAADPPPPVYHPPQRGAPESRVSGGTRGATAETAKIFVLAPEAAGETMTTAPTLYWFVSQAVTERIVATVTQDDVATPLLEVTLNAPSRAGIYALSLANEHLALKPGSEYRWSVALVVDPEQREKDIVASGVLRCVEPSATLQQQLASAPATVRPAIFAGASLWYDALAALSQEIAAAPNAKVFRAHRAALLDQVGLSEAAAFDRAM